VAARALYSAENLGQVAPSAGQGMPRGPATLTAVHVPLAHVDGATMAPRTDGYP